MNSLSSITATAGSVVLPSALLSRRDIALNDGWRFSASDGLFQEMFSGVGGTTAVRLPHDAMRDRRSADAGPLSGYHDGGSFRYEHDLDVPESWRDHTVLIEFEGVYRDARVFIDNELVAHHAYGYTGFTVRIDHQLTAGLRSTISVEARAHDDARWYSGAGIYRPVRLHVLPRTHLVAEEIVVTAPDVAEDSAVVVVEAGIVNDGPTTRPMRVRATIFGPDGYEVASEFSPVTLRPGDHVRHTHRVVVASPKLWDVDHPHLYRAIVTLEEDDLTIDEVDLHVGIRRLQLDAHHGLRINGREVKLRGGAIHHDNGPLGAATIGRAEERRVQLMKKAGFNAIRTAHNPASRALLEACDREGMLVVNEAFDVWTRGKNDHDYSLVFAENWEDDLRKMIVSARNHPSVVMYSTGNEILEVADPSGARVARELANFVRGLDPTRFVTNALQLMWLSMEEFGDNVEDMNLLMGLAASTEEREFTDRDRAIGERVEEFSSVLDVVGYNYADERYAFDRIQFPNRVVFGSETFPSKIATYWRQVMNNPHVIGDFTWVAWDYLGEVGVGSIAFADEPGAKAGFLREYPFISAGDGDFDITGHRCTISYYREIVFGLRSDPYIAVQAPRDFDREIARKLPWALTDAIGSWSWGGNEGRPVRVEVYADADEVSLVLNGEEVGRSAVGENFPLRADFVTRWEPGKLEAVAYRGRTKIGQHVLTSPAGKIHLHAAADRARLLANDDDLAYVEISLRDKDGIIWLGHDRPVTVEVTGAGELAGLGSAAPATEEFFGASQRRTFQGRALAIIRPTAPGPVNLTISAEGLDPVTVRLDVDSTDE